MRTLQFHTPHFHWAHRSSSEPHHPHRPLSILMRRVEGGVDYATVLGIVALGAAMAYGLLTASGRAPWF